MLRNCCRTEEASANQSGLCDLRHRLMRATSEAGCEAEWLGSLLEVLADRLDQAGETIDPARSVRIAADVGRIAREWSDRLSGKMLAAEEMTAEAEGPALQ
jgi:hypothetical protein